MSRQRFPRPPRSFTDAAGREIDLRAFDGADPDRAALVEMYGDFDPADRAQGIPPSGEAAVREWVDSVLEDSVNVLAWHGDDVVGHATLVADPGNGHELAIFVDQSYQGAGVGTALIRTLLGHGVERGVEDVWLTVERWNRPAIALYEKVGFDTADAGGFELEMRLDLHGEDGLGGVQ